MGKHRYIKLGETTSALKASDRVTITSVMMCIHCGCVKVSFCKAGKFFCTYTTPIGCVQSVAPVCIENENVEKHDKA